MDEPRLVVADVQRAVRADCQARRSTLRIGSATGQNAGRERLRITRWFAPGRRAA